MPTKTVKKIDIDGSEAVSTMLQTLLNSFPALSENQKISFSTLDEASGIGFFPVGGSAILTEKKTITGRVIQRCAYPFNIIYRAAPKTEQQRIRIKEFLDILGAWLEKQTITVDGTEHRIEEYPTLTSGTRVIETISRTSTGYLAAAYQDGIEDWTVSAQIIYINEFNR